MEENMVIEYFDRLIETYTVWVAVSLIVGTFLLVMPFNYLFKFIAKKLQSKLDKHYENNTEDKNYISCSEAVARARKVLTTCMAFVVSFVLSLVYMKVCKKDFEFSVLFGNSIPCALCAMALWSFWKAVKQIGVAPVVTKLATVFKKPIKEAIDKMDLPKGVGEVVYNQLCEFVEKNEAENSDAVIANSAIMVAKANKILNNFVNTELAIEYSKAIYDCVKTKYEKKK